MDLVAIGIPVYKSSLNEYETISLQQINRILWRYPKKFIAPRSLELDYGSIYANWEIERFPDEFFTNTNMYSQLLMSECFYQRFQKYRYLLICQLDAFVFSDRLEEFCLNNYDYIGAPVPSMVPSWGTLKLCVGNGGLSLRNVAQSLLCVRERMRICDEAAIYGKLLQTEDLFFSYCGVSHLVNFKIPSRQKAEQFSVDFDTRRSYLRVMKSLPFGCHGWYFRNYDFWEPLIKQFGYKFSRKRQSVVDMDSQAIRYRFVLRYLSLRILRAPDISKLKMIIEHVLPARSWGVWGYGDDGKRCCSLLTLAAVKITTVYDRKFVVPIVENGISYTYPNSAAIKQDKVSIIVATSRCEDSIIKELQDMGLRRGKEIFSYRWFEEKIVNEYYSNL